MKRSSLGAGLRLAVASLVIGVGSASTQVNLGTAEAFGVLGGASVTNTGPTVIQGDLGVSPGTAVSGFPPGLVIGTTHITDAVASQAQADANTAYSAIARLARDVDLTGQDLGGLTLTPGVYRFTSSAQLTGALALDALGNDDALFVFQIGSTLTTASNASVMVVNGGTACNVFWQVGSSATLGTDSEFLGTILALASITATTSTDVTGRLLALNGSVTLDTNDVMVPTGCNADVVPHGMGCPGEAGFVPMLSLDDPVAGGSATLDLQGGLGGATAIVVFGAGPVNHPLKPMSGCGCTLYVRPGPYMKLMTLDGMGAGDGSFSLGFDIPPGLEGYVFAVQVFVVDPSSACGYSASNALLVTVG